MSWGNVGKTMTQFEPPKFGFGNHTANQKIVFFLGAAGWCLDWAGDPPLPPVQS